MNRFQFLKDELNQAIDALDELHDALGVKDSLNILSLNKRTIKKVLKLIEEKSQDSSYFEFIESEVEWLKSELEGMLEDDFRKIN